VISRGERRWARIPLATVPVLVYAGVTIVAPALNGAWRREEFVGHALLTLLTTGVIAALTAFVPVARDAMRRARARDSQRDDVCRVAARIPSSSDSGRSGS